MATTKKPKSANNLTPAAKAALKRIKAKHGVTHNAAIERGVLILESQLTPQPKKS